MRAEPDRNDPQGGQHGSAGPARGRGWQRRAGVEDGPTLTHGGMKYGAGVVAARQAGASTIVDPRPYVTGTIAEALERYDVGPVLRAEGYSVGQLAELEQAIGRTSLRRRDDRPRPRPSTARSVEP